MPVCTSRCAASRASASERCDASMILLQSGRQSLQDSGYFFVDVAGDVPPSPPVASCTDWSIAVTGVCNPSTVASVAATTRSRASTAVRTSGMTVFVMRLVRLVTSVRNRLTSVVSRSTLVIMSSSSSLAARIFAY